MKNGVKEVENGNETILIVSENVSGSQLMDILNEGKTESEILAERIEKAKKLRQKLMDEESEAQRLADLRVAQMREEKRKKQLALDLANEANLLALLEAEEAKIAEAEAKEKEKNDSIAKLNESIKRVESNLNKLGYKTKILPLLNVLSNYQIELNSILNPSPIVVTTAKKSTSKSDSSDKKTDSEKKKINIDITQSSAFNLVARAIIEAGMNGISKTDIQKVAFNYPDRKASQESINWSVSELSKKTDFQFSVIDGKYFAK